MAGVSQSTISAIERASIADLPIATAVRVLTALDVRIDLRLLPPLITGPMVRDRAHARCVAYVVRQLEVAGWLVATEVAVSDGRWHGFIDVLAYHPIEHVLLVIEVKTTFDDVGAIDRQLGMYERLAWTAAQDRGWRPRAITGALLVLATGSNDRRLVEHRRYLGRRYRLRSAALLRFIADPHLPPPRGERGLAMIDPRTRRVRWLIPGRIDGRRTPTRYEDVAAYLDPARSGSRSCSRSRSAREPDQSGRSRDR